MGDRRVSVWMGKGRWVSIPCGTPEEPLTDEELREARFELNAEEFFRSAEDDAAAYAPEQAES